MLHNAFVGRSKPPGNRDLSEVLGESASHWRQLLTNLKGAGIEDQEWSSYSPKAGWSLRLKHGGRNIVYLSPSQGAFMASFALGERAVKAARAGNFSPQVVKILKEAKHYAEGTAVRIEVKTPEDVAVVTKLAAIKLAN
jgi:uncharacterized protein DUF3788